MSSFPLRFNLLGAGLLFLLSLPLAKAQTGAAALEKGSTYTGQDQLDSARYWYQQAYASDDPAVQLQAIGGFIKVAIREADVAQADSLLQVGDQLLAEAGIDKLTQCEYQTIKGEFLRQNSQFEKALAIHQEVARQSADLEGGAMIHANALYYIGLTHERLTNYDSSLIYVERAYPLFLEQLDSMALEFSSIYNGMAVCYYRANQLDKAKAFYLKSIAIAEEELGPVSSDLAIGLNNLASIFRSEANYHQAIAYTERALQIFRALGDENGASGAYYGLGVYHYYLGDYGRTKDYMQACIDIRERLFDANHYSLIGPYEVLGITYEESGDYQRTLDILQTVRAKIMANYGAGSLVEGYNYENTAISYQSLGQLDSALHYIQLASAIYPNYLPEDDYGMAVHYFSYSHILYLLDRPAEALRYLQRSNQVYESLGLSEAPEYAGNLAMAGLIKAKQNNWNAADRRFAESLDIIRMPGPVNSTESSFQMIPDALTILNEYMDYLFQKYEQTGQAQALQDFERYSAIYLDLSDRFRKQFNDPYTKSILIKDNAAVYDRNIGIYNQLFQQTQNPEYLTAAYNFSEYGRTSMLRDLQDEKIQAYAGVPDSVLQRERKLKKEIADLHQQLMEYPDSSGLRNALFRSKEALNDHISLTLDNYPRYHDLKFNSTIPALEEVQGQLPNGHQLIQYMQDDTAYYALLVTADRSDLAYLGPRQAINTTIESWKRQVMTRDAQGLRTSSGELYRYLWQPLAEQLTSEQVTIIPVGPLFYLNFETLAPSATPDRYLIQDYNISYALSFSVLFSEDTADKAEAILAVAPGFEDAIKEAYQQQLDSLDSPDEAFLRTIRQPWSLKLAEELREKFIHQAYTGMQATESNIKAHLHEGKILYFGTHAIADPADPLRSKLILAKEIGEQKEDGYLHAYELYGLPLQAELAILSACESGLGNIQRGEGMISLAYGIHYAGCPSTVMSLWKVDEKINTQLTQVFLDYLDQGYPKSEALRQAKLDYLATASADLQHPFYWGGMVLMGQDGTVELPRRLGWGLILLVLAAFGLIGFWIRARRVARS